MRKARAISVTARRIDLEPHVGRFLLVCASIRDVRVDAGFDATSLMRLVDELLPAPESRAHLESTTASAGAFLKVAGELACYLYYAATILDYFDEAAEEGRWRNTTALHHLAQARQAFSTSTRLAWESISSFRNSWDMPALQCFVSRMTWFPVNPFLPASVGVGARSGPQRQLDRTKVPLTLAGRQLLATLPHRYHTRLVGDCDVGAAW
jgi:hypothetical protein